MPLSDTKSLLPSALSVSRCGLRPNGDGSEMTATRAIVALSMTDTVSLSWSATYTLPLPFGAETATGLAPTGIVASTSPVVASNAATMCVDAFVTHSVPAEPAPGVAMAERDIAEAVTMSGRRADIRVPFAIVNGGDAALRALPAAASAVPVATVSP